jgi:hypothetical protein
MTENQQRFLRAIAERIPARQIAQVRLFPTIRQGQMESAVAVVAVEQLLDARSERVVPLDAFPGDGPPGDALPADDSPGDTPPAHDAGEIATPPGPDQKFSVLTARYRLAIKGPDRGAWEFEMVHDADAPLDTVERVVRGVSRRVGEDGEPDLLSASDFHRAVTEPWWSDT